MFGWCIERAAGAGFEIFICGEDFAVVIFYIFDDLVGLLVGHGDSFAMALCLLAALLVT